MPFTPTHVVAVVPLWPLRRFLPFAALVIGSMVPDLPLFFPFVDYAQTHSPLGLFTACLPMGVAIFLLFELVMRRPLIELLPMRIGRLLPIAPRIPTTPRILVHLFFFAGVALAVVIGAFTHQLWDSFTHQDRWGTRLVPALNSQIDIGGYLVPGYKMLQYGSTFVGLPLLAILATFELNRTTADNDRSAGVSVKIKRLVASLVFITPLLVGAWACATCPNAYQALGMTIKRSGAIILAGCFLYCILFQQLPQCRRDA